MILLTQSLRDFRVLISYTCPGQLRNPVQQQQLELIRRNLQATLLKVGMATEVMDAQGLINELGNILNYRPSAQPETLIWNEYEALDKQLFDQDNVFKIEKDGVIKDGETIIKTWFPKIAPRYWSLSQMDQFFGDVLKPHEQIPCCFALHYGFVMNGNQFREKAKVATKREALERSMRNRLLRWQPQIAEEYNEVAEAVEQIQRDQRMITAALSMTVFCPTHQLSNIEQHLQKIWLDKEWNFSPATYDHLGAFLSILPMSWTAKINNTVSGCGDALRFLNKAKKTITREAQNMLPMLGEWKGQMSPGLPLAGRRGQLFFWNPFDGMLLPDREIQSNTSNYNVCISGTMGSGKSFFANEMIQNVLGVGGRAIVLDKGESFKELCSSLGGYHLDFNVNTDLSINLFTNIPEGNTPAEQEDRAEQLAVFDQVLKTMAMPEHAIDSLQETYLKKALRAVWSSQKSRGTIDDIRAWLFSQRDERAKDLGEMLWAFSSEGIYGKFFNTPATVNLKHDLIVIETQSLKDDLRPVVVQIMMMQACQRMVMSDRSVPYLIVIDEAWQLLSGSSGGKFIENITRTARKYRASLVLLTQNLTDYFKENSPAARIAFENAAWKCILHQSQEITTAMKDHPNLKEFVSTGYRETLIRSLQPAVRFSEIAIFGQQVHGVIGRLFCDPYSVLLYSTKPQDHFEVNQAKKQGLSTGQAIEYVLRSRGQLS